MAIDSSKFKAVNSRDRNFTPGKIDKRQQQIEQSIQRYLDALETADRTQPRGARGQDRAAAGEDQDAARADATHGRDQEQLEAASPTGNSR